MREVIAPGLASAVLTLASPSLADVAWVGDLETGDLTQWDGTLNGQNITVEGAPAAQGLFSARIVLTNDAVWPNGLKRVELHHGPDPARTAEGAQTFFAWSFYLPETLPADPPAQIGYWESDQSYQQMMAFQVEGERIRFDTRRPMNQNHWDADGVVTAGVWHRVAMRVFWSKDVAQGEVDVWFDNVQVVVGAQAETLADDNPHFTQVGLLRGAVDFADAPVIHIDDAVEGDTLADVRPDALEQGAGGGGGGSPATTTGVTAGGTSAAAGPSSSAATGGGTGGGGAADDGGGDGCSARPGGSGAGDASVTLGLLLAWAVARRRGARAE